MLKKLILLKMPPTSQTSVANLQTRWVQSKNGKDGAKKKPNISRDVLTKTSFSLSQYSKL